MVVHTLATLAAAVVSKTVLIMAMAVIAAAAIAMATMLAMPSNGRAQMNARPKLVADVVKVTCRTVCNTRCKPTPTTP